MLGVSWFGLFVLLVAGCGAITELPACKESNNADSSSCELVVKAVARALAPKCFQPSNVEDPLQFLPESDAKPICEPLLVEVTERTVASFSFPKRPMSKKNNKTTTRDLLWRVTSHSSMYPKAKRRTFWVRGTFFSHDLSKVRALVRSLPKKKRAVLGMKRPPVCHRKGKGEKTCSLRRTYVAVVLGSNYLLPVRESDGHRVEDKAEHRVWRGMRVKLGSRTTRPVWKDEHLFRVKHQPHGGSFHKDAEAKYVWLRASDVGGAFTMPLPLRASFAHVREGRKNLLSPYLAYSKCNVIARNVDMGFPEFRLHIGDILQVRATSSDGKQPQLLVKLAPTYRAPGQNLVVKEDLFADKYPPPAFPTPQDEIWIGWTHPSCVVRLDEKQVKRYWRGELRQRPQGTGASKPTYAVSPSLHKFEDDYLTLHRTGVVQTTEESVSVRIWDSTKSKKKKTGNEGKNEDFKKVEAEWEAKILGIKSGSRAKEEPRDYIDVEFDFSYSVDVDVKAFFHVEGAKKNGTFLQRIRQARSNYDDTSVTKQRVEEARERVMEMIRKRRGAAAVDRATQSYELLLRKLTENKPATEEQLQHEEESFVKLMLSLLDQRVVMSQGFFPDDVSGQSWGVVSNWDKDGWMTWEGELTLPVHGFVTRRLASRKKDWTPNDLHIFLYNFGMMMYEATQGSAMSDVWKHLKKPKKPRWVDVRPPPEVFTTRVRRLLDGTVTMRIRTKIRSATWRDGTRVTHPDVQRFLGQKIKDDVLEFVDNDLELYRSETGWSAFKANPRKDLKPHTGGAVSGRFFMLPPDCHKKGATKEMKSFCECLLENKMKSAVVRQRKCWELKNIAMGGIGAPPELLAERQCATTKSWVAWDKYAKGKSIDFAMKDIAMWFIAGEIKKARQARKRVKGLEPWRSDEWTPSYFYYTLKEYGAISSMITTRSGEKGVKNGILTKDRVVHIDILPVFSYVICRAVHDPEGMVRFAHVPYEWSKLEEIVLSAGHCMEVESNYLGEGKVQIRMWESEKNKRCKGLIKKTIHFKFYGTLKKREEQKKKVFQQVLSFIKSIRPRSEMEMVTLLKMRNFTVEITGGCYVITTPPPKPKYWSNGKEAKPVGHVCLSDVCATKKRPTAKFPPILTRPADVAQFMHKARKKCLDSNPETAIGPTASASFWVEEINRYFRFVMNSKQFVLPSYNLWKLYGPQSQPKSKRLAMSYFNIKERQNDATAMAIRAINQRLKHTMKALKIFVAIGDVAYFIYDKVSFGSGLKGAATKAATKFEKAAKKAGLGELFGTTASTIASGMSLSNYQLKMTLAGCSSYGNHLRRQLYSNGLLTGAYWNENPLPTSLRGKFLRLLRFVVKYANVDGVSDAERCDNDVRDNLGAIANFNELTSKTRKKEVVVDDSTLRDQVNRALRNPDMHAPSLCRLEMDKWQQRGIVGAQADMTGLNLLYISVGFKGKYKCKPVNE